MSVHKISERFNTSPQRFTQTRPIPANNNQAKFIVRPKTWIADRTGAQVRASTKRFNAVPPTPIKSKVSDAHMQKLAKMLRDADRKVRLKAVEGLRLSEDVRAIPHLINAFINAGFCDGSFRAVVTKALISMKGVGITGAILKGLESRNSYLQSTVARILGERGDPKAIPLLLCALHNPDYDVSRAAAHALLKFNSPWVMRGLNWALRTGQSHVRLVAVEALGAMEHGSAMDGVYKAMQDENHDVRLAACKIVAAKGDWQDIPVLLEAYRRGPANFRKIAERGLLRICRESTVNEYRVAGKFVQALKKFKGDKNAFVRKLIVYLMSGIKSRQMVYALFDVLGNDVAKVRKVVLEVLPRITDLDMMVWLFDAIKAYETRADGFRDNFFQSECKVLVTQLMRIVTTFRELKRSNKLPYNVKYKVHNIFVEWGSLRCNEGYARCLK